jgi:hypothetical protein
MLEGWMLVETNRALPETAVFGVVRLACEPTTAFWIVVMVSLRGFFGGLEEFWSGFEEFL